MRAVWDWEWRVWPWGVVQVKVPLPLATRVQPARWVTLWWKRQSEAKLRRSVRPPFSQPSTWCLSVQLMGQSQPGQSHWLGRSAFGSPSFLGLQRLRSSLLHPPSRAARDCVVAGEAEE